MSFTSVITAPMKYFRKKVISFLVVHRHDLQEFSEVLRYISLKPNASVSVLRHKIWHLLDLPDYCEELIVLKTSAGEEIPLTALHKGNDSKCPYVLEVWPPRKRANLNSSTLALKSRTWCEGDVSDKHCTRSADQKNIHCVLPAKNMEPSVVPSSSSIFSRLNRKRSRDSLSSLLLKMQADLSMLTTKVSGLENKIVS